MCCKRLAPIRFVPFSYFCTCWNVSPSPSPSVGWLIPSIIRRIRTRLPTCLSIGLGAFLAFCFTVPPNYHMRGRASRLRRRRGPSRGEAATHAPTGDAGVGPELLTECDLEKKGALVVMRDGPVGCKACDWLTPRGTPAVCLVPWPL